MSRSFFKYSMVFISFLFFISCTDDDDNANTIASTAIVKEDVVKNYADVVFKSYEDSYESALSFQVAVTLFIEEPTESSFEAVKSSWKTAREAYVLTDAFRFSSGPIDNADGPEKLLNSWPINPEYIDYTASNATSGIINDAITYPVIDKATLLSLHQVGEDKNSSVGFHALEFLLWGEDTTVPSDKMPGLRTYMDFLDGSTATNQDRRRMYLVVCAELIVEQLNTLVEDWNEEGLYRATFLALDTNVALTNIFTGIVKMTKIELAENRLFAAYESKDDAEEQARYSDHTQRELQICFEGIKNVYQGNYNAISGSGLKDMITEVNPAMGAQVIAHLLLAETAIKGISEPFDFSIVDEIERPKVLASIDATRLFGDKLVAGALTLGITVTLD